MVKQNLSTYGENAEIAVIDGSPGIGCPIISSVAGVDLVLLVLEPSLSGLERPYPHPENSPSAACSRRCLHQPLGHRSLNLHRIFIVTVPSMS